LRQQGSGISESLDADAVVAKTTTDVWTIAA